MPVKKGRTRRGRRLKRRRTSRRKVQKGGVRIGGGTYGSVWMPSLCPGAAANEVGKLMPYKDAIEEHTVMAMLRDLPGFQEDDYWNVNYLGFCRADPAHPDLAGAEYQDLRNSIIADAQVQATDHTGAQIFNAVGAPVMKSWKVLRYEYGGPTVLETAMQILTMPVADSRVACADLMRSFHSLFYGILKMVSQYQIAHRDLKLQNIVCQFAGGRISSVKMIDFGFCVQMSNPRQRLFRPEQCNYSYWPLEAIVCCTSEGLRMFKKTNETLRGHLFSGGVRDTYLGFCGIIDTAANRLTAVQKMRLYCLDVATHVLRKAPFVSLQAHIGTAVDTTTFDVDRFTAALAAPPTQTIGRLLDRFHDTVRGTLLRHFDLFSLGICIQELLNGLSGRITPLAPAAIAVIPFNADTNPPNSVPSFLNPGYVYPPAAVGITDIFMAFTCLLQLARKCMLPNGHHRVSSTKAADYFSTLGAAFLQLPLEDMEANSVASNNTENEPNLSNHSSNENE